MIEYYIDTSIEADEARGTQAGEKYLSIHFPDLYKQKIQNGEIENVFSLNSLQRLAEEISTKYSEVKSIHAVSWLLGSPIGKRLGFRTFPVSVFQRGAPFWGQFVTKNGNIDEARAQQFLETGKPPFAMLEGYIPRDEFLAKYLPKNKTDI